MKTLALLALLAVACVPVEAQTEPMKFFVLDSGSKLAGPFDDYYSCTKMLEILRKQTSDILICAQHN